MNIYDKLAKALAYRKYSFLEYMHYHEYSTDQVYEANTAYLECLGFSNAYSHITNEEIEELLDNQPITKRV